MPVEGEGFVVEGGSRLAIVFSGSPLFSGAAGSSPTTAVTLKARLGAQSTSCTSRLVPSVTPPFGEQRALRKVVDGMQAGRMRPDEDAVRLKP